MNFNNYIFNNKKFVLFLIILIFGFLCIGSSFAVNVDDSNNNLNIGSNVTLKSDSNNLNNNLVINEVNSKHLDFENLNVNNVSIVSNESDFRAALKNKSPEIRFANNITLTGYIEVSNKVKIDGNGYTLRNLKNQNGFIYPCGAIQLSARGSTISNCIFEKTQGMHGGAINVDCGNCKIINCTFNNCHASSSGGAIYSVATFANGWTVKDCTFNNCSAMDGAAIYANSIKWDIIGCTFNNCTAKNDGVISLCRDSYSYSKVINCSFNDCHVNKDGIIFSANKLLIVNNSRFINCSSDGCGGAIYLSFLSYDANITNCIFINCSSNKGGAIFSHSQNLIVNHCIFVNITSTINKGKVIFFDCVDGKIQNSQFYTKYSSDVLFYWKEVWYNFWGYFSKSNYGSKNCTYFTSDKYVS